MDSVCAVKNSGDINNGYSVLFVFYCTISLKSLRWTATVNCIGVCTSHAHLHQHSARLSVKVSSCLRTGNESAEIQVGYMTEQYNK